MCSSDSTRFFLTVFHFLPQDKPKTSKSPADKSQSPGKKRPTEKSAAEKTSPEAKVSPGSKRPATGRGEGKTERGGKRPKKKHGTGEMEGTGQRPKNTTRRSVASKVSYKDESSEEEADRASEEEFQLSSGGESEEEEEEGGKKKGRAGKGKGVAKGKSRAPRRSSGANKTKKEIKSEEEDEEGEEETGKKRREGKGNDEWLEVYLEEAGRWVCVDVEQGVGQVQKCAAHATRPLVYVVGVDGEGYIKDLSRRYDPTWLTSSRKRRIDQDWWDETLDIYEAPDSEREKKEDNEVAQA